MNSIILIGNLTRDPDLTTTNNHTSVCKFSIAVNRNFVNANNEREVDFFNIVVWRGLADNCAKYLSKGNKVGIKGRLENRSYENKEGVKKTVSEVIAEEVNFLTPKASEGDSKKEELRELTPEEIDDLPF